MKSQVTRFLPATFSKWFGQSSSANGSAMLAESSTEDEATKSPITIPPPAKRMRYSPSAKNSSSHYTPISTKTSSTNTEESFNTAPSTSDKMFRRNTNLLLTPRQKNDESTISTSDSKINKYYLYKSDVHIERKRKSIFDKTHNSDTDIDTKEEAVEKSASAKVVNFTQPHLNDGLLSSPFDTSTSTYGGAGGSFINQPNINRRRKAVVKEPNTNSNVLISYSSRRVLDLLENYSSPVTEARRIPSYTTPTTKSLQAQADTQQMKNNSYKMRELHVPQTASLIRLKQKQLTNSTNAARQIIASLSSSAPYPQSPISQNQSVPEKEKLTTKIKSMLTRTNRKAIENSPAPPPVNLPTIPLQIDQDNLPKILFNSTYTSTSTSSTDVALKTVNTQMNIINNAKDAIMNLPNQKPILCVEGTNSLMRQFKFSSPLEISVEQSTGLTATFSFSSPEKNLDSVKSPTGFTFLQTESQPKIVGDKADNVNLENNTCKGCCYNSKSGKNKCAVCDKKTNSNMWKLPISANLLTAAPDRWKCSECWVENERNSVACVSCGVKKTGATTHPSKTTDSEDAKSVKWKCSDCWVDNDSGASKCVCCGAIKTAVKSTLTYTIPAQTNKWRCCWVENDSSAQKCIFCGGHKSGENISQPIKPDQTATWKCKDCWVENNRSASKCVCCGWVNTAAYISDQQKTNCLTATTEEKTNHKSTESKHVAPSNPKRELKSTNLPFQRTTQSQSDKWECLICLIRNEHNRIKCVCCEAEKPGTKKEPEIKFSFKDNPGALFKFGIPAGEKQDTNVQVPSITKETPAKESEINNNVLPKATFSFGIPKNTHETATSVGDSKKDEPLEPMFTFGINKSTSSSTSVEVPKPLFSQSKTPEIISLTVPKKPVVTSVVQPSTPVSTPAPIVSDSNLFVSTVTTPISIASNSGPPVTQSEQKTSTQSLSFSNSPTSTISAPSSNVLSTSISAAASTSMLSFSPGMKSVSPISEFTSSSSTFPSVTAATSSIPALFSKSESVKPEPTSLFQKSVSTPVYLPVFSSNTTTTTPVVSQLPTTSAAPVFCFNNTLYKSAPNNEKPKFNFKFGNNSSNETPMLKTFGATSECNNFTLPVPNGSVMSTRTSSNSALTGIKGLPTENTLLGADNGGNQQNTGNASSIASSTPATGLFGNPIPKANNIWPTNNNIASTQTQFENRVANFTFNAVASSAFGAPQQSSQNIFGISNQNTNSSQPTCFNTAQNPQSNTFGNLPASNVHVFGATNISNTTFGTSTNTSGVFGFSQQQQPQEPTGMFNFGSGGTIPQVQFNMGSAPYSTAARRVRKAVRRTRR